jgi:fermentation-respiration switch protein FrsA (DUF1100 family)
MRVRTVLTALLAAVAILAAAALLLRWSEPRLIYFPVRPLEATPAAVGLPFEEAWLVAADGTRLHAWFVPPPARESPVVLFLHGNAGNVSHRLEKLALLREAGAGVLIVDYRGYGLSEGRPGEAGLYLDARAAYDHLTGTRRVPATHLVAYGESLGTAVAAHLSARAPVGGLVLESGFTSAADVARELYGWLPVARILRSRFDTLAEVSRVRAPLLILHSRGDEFFGWHHAERLLAAAPGPKRLIELRGGHNDAFYASRDTYVRALREFLATIRESSSAEP